MNKEWRHHWEHSYEVRELEFESSLPTTKTTSAIYYESLPQLAYETLLVIMGRNESRILQNNCTT